MTTLLPFAMTHEAVAAYHDTLSRLREVSSHFPSWQAMMEEEAFDVLSSLSLSFLPPPPRQALVSAWLVASTVKTADARDHVEDRMSMTRGCRWTRFLALWISLRLAGLIASPEAPESAPPDVVHRELEVYESSFLLSAWPMLPAAQRERILLRLTHLRQVCRAQMPRVLPPPTHASSADEAGAVDDDNSYEAACRVISYAAQHASQYVARDYLRITWDVLSPKEVPAVVDGRLNTLFAVSNTHHDGREAPALPPLAATLVVHTTCLGGLLQTLLRTQQQQHHAADPTYPVWMRTVRTALIQVGFDLVVKVRAAMIDVCYAALPALADFDACVQLCEVMEGDRTQVSSGAPAGAPGDEEESEKRAQLRRSVAALLQAVKAFYEDAMRKVLAGYRKQCTSASTPPRLLTATAVEAPVNPLAPPPQPQHGALSRLAENASPVYTTETAATGAATPNEDAGVVSPARQQLALSQAAYALLVGVVEPTCNILRRYAAEVRFSKKVSGPDAAVPRSAASALAGDARPPFQRLQTSERDVTGTAVAKRGGASTPSSRAAVTATHAFTDFFLKKLDVCFAEALTESRSGTASAKAQEQAAMDAYITAVYLAAALRI